MTEHELVLRSHPPDSFSKLSEDRNVSKASMGPIETEMRRTLITLKNSKFEDTFDWGIYDKIAARYGSDQPRGGVVFNTTLKLVNSHITCSKCHYAFEVDTYGRGCIHDCVYCYAKESLTTHGYWNRPMPFPVNLAEIRKVFYTVFETQKPNKWRSILEARIPIRIGSMSDSFMWMDRKYKVTQEFLKILSFYNYPYLIFTRSDLIIEDEYLSVLRKDLASIQFSISGNNEALTKKIEPGAPNVERRLVALQKLAEEGFWTTVRLNPFFPMYPDGYFTDNDSIKQRFGDRSKCPEFPLFNWDLIAQLKQAKVPSVLAGFVRLSARAITNLSKTTGVDFKLFFRPEVFDKFSDKRYTDGEINHYYQRLRGECWKHNVRFNTCYIGNGEKDYYNYQHMWTNKNDCCDAKGNVSAFEKTSQNIDWPERLKFAPCKTMAAKAQIADEQANLKYGIQSRAMPNQRMDIEL